MDDRNLVSKEPSSLEWYKDRWLAWSASVGLSENISKLVVVVSKTSLIPQLQRTSLFQYLKDWARVLGACTASQRRQITDVENSRLMAARRALHLLASIRLPFRNFHIAAGTYVLPKASFGWLAIECLPNNNPINRGRASVLLGGNSHLQILTVKQCLGAILWNQDRSFERWNGAAGHVVSNLKKVLVDIGFTPSIPSTWNHFSGTILDLSDPRCPKPRLFHKLRASWRASMFKNFLESGRREAQDFSEVPWSDFTRVDFTNTRTWLFSAPAPRTMALLSFVSPQWLTNSGRPSSCPWCGSSDNAYFEHLAGQCSARPSSLARPASSLVARMGWDDKSPNPTALLEGSDLRHTPAADAAEDLALPIPWEPGDLGGPANS